MPLPVSRETVLKRLMGIKDSRGPVGMFARGKNIYNAASTRGNYKGRFGKGGLTTLSKRQAAAKKLLGLTPEQLKAKGYIVKDFSPKVVTPQKKSFTDYPFDREYERGLGEITRRGSEIKSMEELARRRLGEDYGNTSRELERGYTEGMSNLEQRMANQGILRSGTNVQEQGELGQERTRESELLEQERSRGLEDITREVTSGQQQLQREKEQLDYERLQRLKMMELERAKREAEAKANKALLLSLQPSSTGKIPLPKSTTGKKVTSKKKPVKKPVPKKVVAPPNAGVWAGKKIGIV